MYRSKKFLELYQKYKETVFEPINVCNKTVLRCILHPDIYEFCYELALKKAKKTINHGESMQPRTLDKKVDNALQGIMAETYAHFLLLLMAKIKNSHIDQFDITRPSWEHPAQWNPPNKEYDIRIKKPEFYNYISIEVKSSYNSMNLNSFMNKGHLIGGHINHISERVDVNDFYLQTYYTSEDKETIQLSFANFQDNVINLYILVGLSQKDLYTKGISGTLSTQKDKVKRDDVDRIASLIEEHREEIEKATTRDELRQIIQDNQKEAFEPLYIQILNKDADSLEEICAKINESYASLLISGLLYSEGFMLTPINSEDPENSTITSPPLTSKDEQSSPKLICDDCGKSISQKYYDYSIDNPKMKKPLCWNCQQKYK